MKPRSSPCPPRLRRAAPLLALLLVGPALAGCLGIVDPTGRDGISSLGESPLPRHVWNVSNGFNVSVQADRTVLPVGETVTLTLRAQNAENDRVHFRDGCFQEWVFQILDRDTGEEVATWPQGACLGFTNGTLGPGDAHVDVVEMDTADWTPTDSGRRGGDSDGDGRFDRPGAYRLRVLWLFSFEEDGPRHAALVHLDVDLVE